MNEDQGKRMAVTIRTAEGESPTVIVAGELDLSTAGQVASALKQLLENEPTEIGFDLGGVTFMDSSGLAVLITAAQYAAVSVRASSQQVRRIIELTGLTSVLRLA